MNLIVNYTFDLVAVSPELFLTTIILVLVSYGAIISTSKSFGFPLIVKHVSVLSVLTLLYTILLYANNPVSKAICFSNLFLVDTYTSTIKIIICLGIGAVIAFSFEYLRVNKLNSFEFPLLVLLSGLGVLLLVSSFDLISVYLAIEFQSLCFYVLAAYKRNSEYSTESGLKYFVLGAFASGILLFGISLIYGFTGTTNFEDLFRLFAGTGMGAGIISNGILVGLVFVLVSILFKLYAAPFHVWVPDVYEGAPTPVVGLFAIVPSFGVFSVLIRFFVSVCYDSIHIWQQILLVVSILSILIGTLGGLYQTKFKRLLAYSSISHSGFLLLAVSTGTIEGLQASIFYLMIYILMNIGLFTSLLALRHNGQKGQLKYLSELSNLRTYNPVLALALALLLFSVAGVPPLAGFFSKFFVFVSALHVSFYTIVIIGALLSVVSSVYYLRVIKIMFFDGNSSWTSLRTIDSTKATLLAISVLMVSLFVCYPAPLLTLCYKLALLCFL